MSFYSSSTLKTHDGYEHLLRFCNLYSPKFPVIVFHDGAGIVDFGEDQKVYLSTTMTSLEITLCANQDPQKLSALEDRVTREMGEIISDETLRFDWKRTEVVAS